MTTNTKYIWGSVFAILIIGFLSFNAGKRAQIKDAETLLSGTTTEELVSTTTQQPTNTTEPSKDTKPNTVGTPVNTKGFHSYANSEYHFTIQFPSYAQTRNSFSTFHQIGNNWRLNAGPANQGKGLLEISIFSIDQGSISNGKQKYPLFFAAEVRVGVSPNVKECYTPDSGYTNQKITNVTINGVSFKKFSTEEAGMMKYVQAESYRTVHKNNCYVLEQIKAGSSYRDELMAPGIADSTLTSYYATGETIIRTFKFTE
jgi:hypothetical protein